MDYIDSEIDYGLEVWQGLGYPEGVEFDDGEEWEDGRKGRGPRGRRAQYAGSREKDPTYSREGRKLLRLKAEGFGKGNRASGSSYQRLREDRNATRRRTGAAKGSAQ